MQLQIPGPPDLGEVLAGHQGHHPQTLTVTEQEGGREARVSSQSCPESSDEPFNQLCLTSCGQVGCLS